MTIDATTVEAALDSVVDPEIPVITIEDLGVLRSYEIDGETVKVTITPTYSGCPAMGQIEDDIRAALSKVGVSAVEVETVYSPAWSTDMMSAEGNRKLNEFGIAPPGPESEILCPQCQSSNPKMISRFGSTACKALMVCSSCQEPFDYFKELR